MVSKPTSEPKWQIVAIRKRGQVLGIVQAKDADSAIKLWAAQYDATDPEGIATLGGLSSRLTYASPFISSCSKCELNILYRALKKHDPPSLTSTKC